MYVVLFFKSGIINENIGLTDLMRETWNRVTGYKYNYRTRLIPFWSLILPTSLYFVGHHFLTVGLNKFIGKTIGIFRNIFQENVFKTCMPEIHRCIC